MLFSTFWSSEFWSTQKTFLTFWFRRSDQLKRPFWRSEIFGLSTFWSSTFRPPPQKQMQGENVGKKNWRKNSQKAFAIAIWQSVVTSGRVAMTDPSSEKISPIDGLSTVEVRLMPNGGSWKSGNPPSMFPVNMKVGVGAFTKEKKNNGFF